MNVTDPQVDSRVAGAEAQAPQPTPPPPQWNERSVPAANDPRRRSPMLACVLSAMPGLGQVYVGYYKQGFIHVVVVGSVVALLANATNDNPIIPLLAIFLPFFWLYNIVDAGRRAAYYNQALAGIAGVKVPEEMSLPSPGGSIAGGAVLIVGGLVLLSNTLFGIRLDWLEEWWPAIPVVFGAWLVLRGLKDRQT